MKLPKNWDAERIQKVLKHYENQTDDEAIAEDEQAFANSETVMQVPLELISAVRELIAQHDHK